MPESIYPKIYLYRQIVRATLFIDENYASRIALDQVANAAFFSKFHFIRLFKKIYGQTPHQYLTTLRIEKSMQLLRSGLSVTEACYEVGFESPGSFSSLFRRTTGLTPSAYLSHQQKIRARISKSPLDFIPGCFAEKKGWKQKSNFEEPAY